MLNLREIITSLLLTILLIGRVNGFPLTTNLPTQITPIGVGAPFVCPVNLAGDGAGEGAGEELEPCTNLDNELRDVMESAILPLVRESVKEQFENSLSYVVDRVNEIYNPTHIFVTGEIRDSITNLFEEHTVAILVADSSDFRDALTAAVVDYIESGVYSCKISKEIIAAATNTYLNDYQLQAFIETEIADQSSSIDAILETLIDNSPGDSIFSILQTEFTAEIIFAMNNGITYPRIIASIIDLASGPIIELPTESEVLAAIIAVNTPDEVIVQIEEVETTMVSEVEEQIRCTICSTTKNAIDEVIVKAMTNILSEAEVAGAIDAAGIAAIVSESVSAEVLENAFYDSVPAAISQGGLRISLLETLLKKMSTVGSSNMIDITSIKSVLRSIIETESLEGTLSECVDDYLSNFDAIETTITNAVTNAIINGKVSPSSVASISVDTIIQELVQSINNAMNAAATPSIASTLNQEFSEVLSSVFYDPAVFNLVTEINKEFFTTFIKKFTFSENIWNTNLQAFGGFSKDALAKNKNGVPKLLNNFLSGMMKFSDDVMEESKDNQIAIQDESDKSIAPQDKKKKMGLLSKKLLPLKPIFKKSLKLIGKLIKEYFPQVVASNLEVQSKKRARRAILSKKVKTMKKAFGSLNEAASSLADQFSEVGFWLLKFPPVVNVYNGVREISAESIRKDAIDFLSGFDFIDRQDLEEFSIDGVIEDISSSSLIGDSIIEYLSSWEEYIDGMAVGAATEFNKFNKKVDKFKKSLFPFNLFA